MGAEGNSTTHGDLTNYLAAICSALSVTKAHIEQVETLLRHRGGKETLNLNVSASQKHVQRVSLGISLGGGSASHQYIPIFFET